MTTVNIRYRKNTLYTEKNSNDEPRLYAELDLSGYCINETVKNLAIYYRKLSEPVGPVRVVYSTIIAGLILEAGNLNRLEQFIDDTLKKIIRFERLPEYFFQVKDNAWPIYHLQDELITRYPGGPVFNTEDIASLRLWLADHFKAIGRIQNRREMHLLFLSPVDLQLYAPYCVMRTPDESVPDIPVFPYLNENKLNLIAPVKNTTLVADYAEGNGIFALFDEVGDYLIGSGQLEDPYELTIRKLSMAHWDTVEPKMQGDPQTLVYTRQTDGLDHKVKNPVFFKNNMYFAARPNRLGNVVLYFGPNVSDLSNRIGKELYSYGAISDPKIVEAVQLQ